MLPLSPAAWAQNEGGRPVHNEAERLAKWKRVEMPFRADGLTPRDKQMVARLADACTLLDDIYWRQSDPGGLALYKSTRAPVLRDLFYIMGSRWDLIDDNRPFIASRECLIMTHIANGSSRWRKLSGTPPRLALRRPSRIFSGSAPTRC
jgi:hypothetical protein